MNAQRRRAHLILMLAAAIWGFAFVAQRVGMRHLGPLTFNAIRFALGAAALVPLVLLLKRRGRGAPPPDGARAGRLETLKGGLLAGLLIFGGSTLQQVGVVYTTAGKAGFITSLYVVLVPILGLVWGQRCGRAVWAGALLAAAGLYLLSARGLVGIALGDGLVLVGAVFWAAHVLLVGKLVERIGVLDIALLQFTACSVLSLAGALVYETIAWDAIRSAAVPILYAGLMSVAVAYTLQVVGQRHARPAPAAIILSFEAVFAAVGGWLILGEILGLRGLVGAGLMLAGVILAQTEAETIVPVVGEGKSELA
ncbi:MAG: DMT family transporter [bacterium]